MKKCLILIACGILAAGCIRSPKNTDVKGTVLDASMNTVMILTEKNDTLSFSTLNADRTGLNGLLHATHGFRRKTARALKSLSRVSEAKW